MNHDRETIQARMGVAAALFLIFLVGGMKAMLLLLSLCASCALFGYALFRFVQENVVSVDSDGDVGEAQFLGVESEQRRRA